MENQPPTLKIDGEVETPRAFQIADMKAIAESDRIPDVSQCHPKSRGVAIRLASLLQLTQVRPNARYLTLHSRQDDFYVTVPLESVRGEAAVIYEVDGRGLTTAEGGPFRFLVLNPAACQSAEVDECASIKHLDSIDIRTQPGRDTRPRSNAEHAALHARQDPGLSES